MRGTGARGLAAGAGLRPDKRGPEPKIADKRSATGRAGSGSICPRRILAQWMRISGYAPRGAPLPLVVDARVRARAEISCARHSRAKPSGPAFGRPKNRLRADPRISGRKRCGSLHRPEMLGTSPSRTPWWVRRNRRRDLSPHPSGPDDAAAGSAFWVDNVALCHFLTANLSALNVVKHFAVLVMVGWEVPCARRHSSCWAPASFCSHAV